MRNIIFKIALLVLIASFTGCNLIFPEPTTHVPNIEPTAKLNPSPPIEKTFDWKNTVEIVTNFQKIKSLELGDKSYIMEALQDQEKNYLILTFEVIGRGTFEDPYKEIYKLLKLDRNFNTVWYKTLKERPSGSRFKMFNLQTSSENTYLLMEKSSDGLILRKFDSTAEQLWESYLPGIEEYIENLGNNILASSDDGYLITGDVHPAAPSANLQYVNAYLVKLNATGQVLWTNRYGKRYEKNDSEGLATRGNSVIESPDKGYLIVGIQAGYDSSTYNFYKDTLDSDIYIVKTNQDGKLLWSRVYGKRDALEVATSAVTTKAGDYLISGLRYYRTNDSDHIDNFEILILKINSAGTLIWERTLGANYYKAIVPDSIEARPFLLGNISNILTSAFSDDYLLSSRATAKIDDQESVYPDNSQRLTRIDENGQILKDKIFVKLYNDPLRKCRSFEKDHESYLFFCKEINGSLEVYLAQ